MPFRGEDFQSTRGEAYSELLAYVPDSERDVLVGDLADLENGIRQYWAMKLRQEVQSWTDVPTKSAVMHAAELLDPYNGKGGRAGDFRRSTPEPWDGKDGEKVVKP